MELAEIIGKGIALLFVGFLHVLPYLLLYLVFAFLYYCGRFVWVWYSWEDSPEPEPKPRTSTKQKSSRPKKQVVASYSDDFKLPANPFVD